MARRRTGCIRPAAIAALTLLLFNMTVGSLWHTHSDASSADHCQICHLAHAPARQPAAVAAVQPPRRVIGKARLEESAEKLCTACIHKSPRSPPVEA